MTDHKPSEATSAYRTAIADRAAWFYLLLKHAEEMGIDAEELARKAITQYGVEKGKLFGEVKNAADFAAALFSGYGCGAFAMEMIKETDEESIIRFHHCALVDAWKKRGLDAGEVSRLCRLARHGDLGIVSNFTNLTLSFPRILAEGDDFCELVVRCGQTTKL